MKRLILHIGTHKTATTTFQRICYGSRHLFLQNNIYYPELDDFPGLNNHAPIAWNLDQANNLTGQEQLKNIFNSPESRNCSTTLISSEDLENLLINHTILETIIEVANQFYFDRIELVAVTRNPQDYLLSTYNELSKHGIILNYSTIARSAKASGYFTCSLEYFNYSFAINAKPLIDALQRKFPQIIIYKFSFEEFTRIYPGHAFIAKALSPEVAHQIGTFDLEALDAFNSNEAMSEFDVELQYAFNSLGIKSTGNLDASLHSLIQQIADYRLISSRQGKALAKTLFGAQ